MHRSPFLHKEIDKVSILDTKSVIVANLSLYVTYIDTDL